MRTQSIQTPSLIEKSLFHETTTYNPRCVHKNVPRIKMKRKTRQSTLFVGPGAVKQRLIDNRNMTHYVPMDDESIQALTKSSTIDIVQCQCLNCEKTFLTAQGLGNHTNQ